MTLDWTIPGRDGEPIRGTTHRPRGDARGVVLIAHGFKGYKDYGLFPTLAATIADAGWIAHRFNFSHSGMTDDITTFARPDLFERDTWNRQVDDLLALVDAVGDGAIDGAGLPLVLLGHSRGGASCLLAAARHGAEVRFAPLRGIVTLAAPSKLNSLSAEMIAQMDADGFLVSPSSRTGQDLRIGRAWLDEQRADPAGHDLRSLVSRITVPVTLLHGADDPTVPARCASELASAIGANATVHLIPGANHVFNTPNPFPPGSTPSAALGAMMGRVREALA